MIKGQVKKTITPKLILDKISEYDIYRFYLGNFKLGKAFKSPFRRDKNPSFVVRPASSGLYHVDYGNEDYKGDCFNLVSQLFGISFTDTLNKIDQDFGLGLGKSTKRDYQRIISQYDQPTLEKKYVHILVITRAMTSEELAYWNQYHLSADDLKTNQVFGVQKIYMNRQLVRNYGNELRFAYFNEPHWKIYQPNIKDKKKKFYPNNTPNDYIEKLGNLVNTDIGIITKSRKDRMVISKIFPHVCSTQNESSSAFTEDNIEFLINNCKRPYIAFDNDPPGKKASQELTETYGWKHINVPDKYIPEKITDFADLAKAYGMDAVIKHFQTKGIL